MGRNTSKLLEQYVELSSVPRPQLSAILGRQPLENPQNPNNFTKNARRTQKLLKQSQGIMSALTAEEINQQRKDENQTISGMKARKAREAKNAEQTAEQKRLKQLGTQRAIQAIQEGQARAAAADEAGENNYTFTKQPTAQELYNMKQKEQQDAHKKQYQKDANIFKETINSTNNPFNIENIKRTIDDFKLLLSSYKGGDDYIKNIYVDAFIKFINNSKNIDELNKAQEYFGNVTYRKGILNKEEQNKINEAMTEKMYTSKAEGGLGFKRLTAGGSKKTSKRHPIRRTFRKKDKKSKKKNISRKKLRK
jgi:hypothetical protein